MAAPASVSVQNLTGKYNLNKKLGSDPDALLAMVSLLLAFSHHYHHHDTNIFLPGNSKASASSSARPSARSP